MSFSNLAHNSLTAPAFFFAPVMGHRRLSDLLHWPTLMGKVVNTPGKWISSPE